jgi:Tfp pilus assembly protein PilO
MHLSAKSMGYVLCFILLVIAAVYVNFVSPLRAEYEQKKERIAAKTSELRMLQERKQQDYAWTAREQAALSRLRKQIPEHESMEELIRDVRAMELLSGTSLSQYSFDIPGAALATDKLPFEGMALPIRMTAMVKDDYRSIQKLLEEMKSSNRLLQIEKLAFQAPTIPPVVLNSSSELQCDITFVAYYAPELKSVFPMPIPVDYKLPEERSTPIY